MHKWFLKDDVWHAFLLEAPDALCGEVRIAYGSDPIADFVPPDGEAHKACLAALEPVEEETEDEETEEVVSPKRKAK